MPILSASIQRALHSVPVIAFRLVLFLLPFSVATHAQCWPTLSGRDAAAKSSDHLQLLPEDAYLSNTTYTSTFFGFGLELPIAAQGHLIKLPLMPEKQHALLAIGYQNGAHSGSLTIDAIEPREGLEGFSAQDQQQRMQQQLKDEATGQTQTAPQPGTNGPIQPAGPAIYRNPPPRLLPTERFHSSVHHKGEKYYGHYWTQIKNFKIGVMVATNDHDFLQKSKRAMAGVHFYCTQDDGTLALADGKIFKPDGELYQGPSVPTWRADAAIATKPGLAIPPGEVEGVTYRNPALGMKYEFPADWKVLPPNNSGDPPADATELRAFEFLHACSRALLRITEHGPVDSGSQAPVIVLRALDPTCLAMRTPASLSDTRVAEEAGASLEMLPEFGEIASDELVALSGQVFMVFHGTMATAGGAEIPNRMSQVIFATRPRKTLLVWSFIAPNAKELNAMPATRISIDGSPSIELRPAVVARQ